MNGILEKVQCQQPNISYLCVQTLSNLLLLFALDAIDLLLLIKQKKLENQTRENENEKYLDRKILINFTHPHKKVPHSSAKWCRNWTKCILSSNKFTAEKRVQIVFDIKNLNSITVVKRELMCKQIRRKKSSKIDHRGIFFSNGINLKTYRLNDTLAYEPRSLYHRSCTICGLLLLSTRSSSVLTLKNVENTLDLLSVFHTSFEN